MNLFIDTNIFLSFYHLTSDDLEELKKLNVLLKGNEITLHLTDQIKDEFKRNRENKIRDAIKRLKEQKLKIEFPQICKDYEQYPKLKDIQKEYETLHNELMAQITNDVEGSTLKADEIISELFEESKKYESSDKIIQKAKLRIEIGNPPGKNNSLGDAINWEILINSLPNDEDLYFISDDRDYFSALNDHNPKEFLKDEWKSTKNSEIKMYRRLSSFFKDFYPDIKVASEYEKESAIEKLVASSTFYDTHYAISKLSKFDDFSEPQIKTLIETGISNTQIKWIIEDEDVLEFYKNLRENFSAKMENETLAKLKKLLPKDKEEDTIDDLPF